MAGKRDKKKKRRAEAQEEPAAESPVLPADRKVQALKFTARVLLLVLFFSYLFGVALKYPLNDPDVWWHLETGNWTIENAQIPGDDYFSYTTPKPMSPGEVRGLRTQWLGQVVFALAEKGGGVAGVATLRNLLIVLPMLILVLWLVRRGMNHLAAVGLVTLPASLLVFQVFYAFERPQAFSFLLVLVEIMLLERLRSREKGKFDLSMVGLPALMALWSNLHAGFILGNVIIFIYFGSELLQVLWRKLRGTLSKAAPPAFFASCAAAVPASFINPNTYHVFFNYFTGLTARFLRDFSQTVGGGGRSGWVEQVVLEFRPLYYFYETLHYKWVMYYWIFLGVLFASLLAKYWIKKKVDLAELLTVAMLAFFANYYARGLMFSLTALPFFLAKTALEFRLPPLNHRKLSHLVVASMLVITVGFAVSTYSGRLGRVLGLRVSPYWISPWYPQTACNFIEEVKPEPPMYNFYTWGGFLIWRLYPQYKVFIDGRAINRDLSWTADGILKTYDGWQGQLDSFDINFILIPPVFRESGHIVPLGPALEGEEDWELIYLRNNSAVYVRDVPQNRELIERYGMDKKAIYREIVLVENVLLSGNPYNPNFNLAKADALFALGRYEEARDIYVRFPRQSAKRLEILRQMGY
ncbi:MAG: tetratricopeptide repeat protein [Nitrospirota bacterium]|jgi:hypothetical protein